MLFALALVACHPATKRDGAGSERNAERLLAVGGVHALAGLEPCHPAQVEPATALEDLHWKDALVVRANGEGSAERTCGSQRARLRTVKASWLEFVLVDPHVVVGQRFQVRAVARDHAGKELEIGKWTEIAWRGDGVARRWRGQAGRRQVGWRV